MKFILAENAVITPLPRVGILRDQGVFAFCVEVASDLHAEGVEDQAKANQFWKELELLQSNQISPGKMSQQLWRELPSAGHEASNDGIPLSWAWLMGEILLSDKRGQGQSGICLRVASGPLTKALVEVFGDDVYLQLTFHTLRIGGGGGVVGVNHDDAYSSSMKVRNDNLYACEDSNLSTQLNPIYLTMSQNAIISGRVTIRVGLDEPGFTEIDPGTSVRGYMKDVLKKMLEEEIGSDALIVTGDGKEVKAHAGVISAHSAVFRAMFESDMQEAKTHTLEMPDVSEAGVRALLAYLYHCEDTEPNAKPQVAYEMLCAGHKYDIENLENAMKTLLLNKPNKGSENELWKVKGIRELH